MNCHSNKETPLCEMIKEVKNDFDAIARIARSNAVSFAELDKNIFKTYDYVSKVIPTCRSVLLDDTVADFVRREDYLYMLDCFEKAYDLLKRCL